MYALKQRFHHVAHLDEEHTDLLVVVSALHVKLNHDAEGAHSDYRRESKSGSKGPVAMGMKYEEDVLPMKGCSLATSSNAFTNPGKLSTSRLTPSRTVFIASLSYMGFSVDA